MDDHRDDQTHAWQHVKQVASQEASYRGLGDWRTLPVVTELIEQHVRVMQRCFEDSTDQARQRLVVAFASIELHTVINGLLAAIKQMMLIYVGTLSIGAAISAAMSGGIGIAAGAAVGVELGTVILGMLGLKCLADVFVKSLTVLVSDYAHGVRDAWEAVAYDRHSQAVAIDRFKITTATWKLASAHVALVESLLLAIVAYLSKGQLKTLAAEARIGKLGNAFADWLEQHGNQLKDHPVLVPHHLKPVLLDDGTLISAEEWNVRRAMRRAGPVKPAAVGRDDIEHSRPPARSDPVKTNKEKSLLGESSGRTYMQQAGFERISGDKRWNAAGVDDIWKNTKPPPDYVITEYKYGSSGLGQTKDGLQMSDDWLNGRVTGRDRIKDAVGESEALDIDLSRERGGVEKWLLRVDESGGISKLVLDGAGKTISSLE
jgi:hypothetical protein